MNALHERLAEMVATWRADGYPRDEFPAIAEVLEFAGETEAGELRYLRRPQIRALETYWYLRLVEDTPHIFDLYLRTFPPETDKQGLFDALGVPETAFRDANYELDALWELARTDDDFVRKHRLEALRETLTLDYSSYILALAMGAGKTVLIGAIFATEFAMALEYPDGPFVQNALVFAPGKTIIESLRELTQVPYDRILPPRLHKPFAASLKLTFTRDGEKDVPVVRRSTFNVVVTNTEKIRIRKESIRKSDLGGLFANRELDEVKQEVANLRLQAIASLPHLAVFSDEAHHTYGQSLETGLKKVRRTVDYLAEQTNVVCVVNTTGTPYHRTAAVAAQKLGRRWIGCDINKGAIQTTSKRIQAIIEDQAKAASQGTLVQDEPPAPAQLSFTTWRVNDYDLQIQHNEAVNLAVEHIGIQRTRTDRFFDVTLGKSLVKIAPFTHPLSPADLEEIRQELEARPDDDRNVTVVCLGIEIAAQGWLEEWNRHRRGRNAVNRIEVIELRTDERYGAWLAHEPARAKVRIERKKGTIHVTIDDFVSPTIVKRLAEQTGVVEPRIDDWRAMVDCVMIDTSYDGEVFDIALSDVPERKTDLISGAYELDAAKGKATVAVKIVDMLGEEVLVTKQV